MSSEPSPSRERQNRPPRRYWNAAIRPHWLELVLGVGLLAVGAAQVCIYLRQASIMQAQADLAAEQNKITIAINRAIINLHSIGVTLATPATRYNDYTFKIGNDGNSTTRNLTIIVDCVLNNKAETEPFVLLAAKTNNSIPDLIAPKGEINVPGSGLDCRLPLTEADAIGKGSKHFYLLGKITYSDTISPNIVHTTEFAKELVIEDVSHAVSRGRHNCADDECSKD